MRLGFLNILLLFATVVSALTIPQGVIYFDNTKTNYTHVQFVYGKENTAESYVCNMSKTATTGLWSLTIPTSVADMYRYTFSNTTLDEGLYEKSFPDLKEYISKTINCNRTATTDAYITPGNVFVPESSDNWAQGYWQSLSDWKNQQEGGGGASTAYSGTLPVLYVETQNHAAISSKETYINATLYIDPLSTDYEPFASATSPLAIQIRGRGNYTWKDFDKKPYKVKFADKYSLLGMPANKHWCLMAYADDDLGYLRNTVGFCISEYLGMRWTPHQVPVELMLNGKYEGLYFLVEQIRIGKNRLPLKELEDNCSNPDSITGGWLVEIDNYDEVGNIKFTEGNGESVMVTPKSPEILSASERNYISAQLTSINDALYGSSETDLQSILDFEEAARFYLIQEILEDCESYHGSCYLNKERDKAGSPQQKWFFGPVWDFGNSYMRHQERFIYDNPIFSQIWIGQLATWPAFQTAVKEQWYIFYHNYKERVRNDVETFVAQVRQAAVLDANRWKNTRNYKENSQMTTKKNNFLNNYNWRINWLYSKWGEGLKPADYTPTEMQSVCDSLSVSSNSAEIVKVIRNGQLFILRNGRLYTIHGQAVR